MIINMNGAKAPETPSPVLQEKTVTPETLPTVIGPDEGYDGLSQVTVNPDAQLKAENIRSGKTIFGVAGTFAGEVIHSDTIDFDALGIVDDEPPVVMLIGEYKTSNYYNGVATEFTDPVPSQGATSYYDKHFYCITYNSQKCLRGTSGSGSVSSYVPSYNYKHVVETLPEGDYQIVFNYTELGWMTGTVSLKNLTWVTTASTSKNKYNMSGPNAGSAYGAVVHDNPVIPDQTVTLASGIGMIHLPEFTVECYAGSYDGTSGYMIVALQLYGQMEVIS